MTTHKFYLTRFVLSLLCLFVALTAIRAQQQQSPVSPEPADEDVLRISTELVQTDVVVLDKQGHFVEGLKPEQFELKVDGKSQPIAFFESVTAWNANEEAQLTAARGNARTPTTKDLPALSVKRGRTIIFFIDDLHMSNDSMTRARKFLLRFIDKEMGGDDLVAIASPSGSIGFLQQFTNNKTVLRTAVARLTYHPYSVGDTQLPTMSEFQARAVDRGEPDILDRFIEQKLRENPLMPRPIAESAVKQRASQILKQSSIVTLNMLGSLDTLMRNSTRLPGRKIAFFLSDGFFLDSNNSDTQNGLKRITTTAARSAVVIYTLDSRGLVTGGPDATEAETFDPHGKLARVTATAEISHSQDALATLAEETGGRVYVNSNALDPGLTAALEETSRYYLLSWRPDPEINRGGKFRRLEVSVVGRPDLKVRARRGFLNEETKPTAKEGSSKSIPTPIKSADDELRAAINDLLPRKGVPTFLSVNYVDLPEKVLLLTVAMKVPGDALTYDQVVDKFNATVDVYGGVFDDKGQPLSSFKDQLKVSANSTEQSNLRNQKIIYTSQVPIRPGLYQVRVAARDAQSKRTGSATQWIEIPDLTNGRLTMSSLFISEIKAAQAQAQVDADAFKLTNVSVDRRFAKTSKLLFLTYIYNTARGATGNDAPDVAIQMQVLSGLKPVFTTPLRKVSSEGLTDLARIPYAAEIPLTSLSAGRYLLQITATDRIAKTSTSQSVNFEIE